MTVGDRLNELLEAERAGVETLSRLVPEARSTRKLLEEVRYDEAGGIVHQARPLHQVPRGPCQRTRHIANIEACERS